MFNSILYPPEGKLPPPRVQTPPFFPDVGLASIIDRLEAYCPNPSPFFTPVTDAATISYRQEIGKDLEQAQLRQRFSKLCRELTSMQKQLSAHGTEELAYMFGCGIVTLSKRYVEQLQTFLMDFPYRMLQSRGLNDFVLYIRSCLSRPETIKMRGELVSIQREWDQMEYALSIKGNDVFVGRLGEASYMDEAVRARFAVFDRQWDRGAVCEPPAGETDARCDDGILSLLSAQYPRLLERLLQFGQAYKHFADEKLLRAALDLPFYISWLNETDRLSALGCRFCYPDILPQWSGCYARDCFDLALGQKLAETNNAPVVNDFSLGQNERIVIITGPNQGGKTTFTRMLGQLFYLASLGLRVPGSQAALHPPDAVYTHFARMEQSGEGGLGGEFLRLKAITSAATSDSLVLINEIFASAPRCDGLYLGREMLRLLNGIGCLTVCVTFLTELAAYNEATVSLVGRIAADEKRTYRLEREAPDGCAHAMSLARSKGLTYESILSRTRP